MPEAEAPYTTEVSDAVIAELQEILGETGVKTDERSLNKLSKDYYWYSPILKPKLENKAAAVAVRPRTVADLKAVVKIAFREGLPVSLRGSGTGNYGQMIPLYKGLLIDLSRMDDVEIREAEGVVKAQPGAKLSKIEKLANPVGLEMRCLPSTWIKASIGGFLCGGSGGIGSITHGGINTGDNVKSVTLLTVEAEPRLITFEERDSVKALHTYGTTGILVEVEMRLGKAVPMQQMIFTAELWETALEFGDAIARDDTLPKRLVTGFENGVPDYFVPIREYLPEGCAAVFLLVAQDQEGTVKERGEQAGLTCTYSQPWSNPPQPPYITDYTWNHTTLHALGVDPTITYQQLGFDPVTFRDQMKTLKERFGDEILWHLEWTKGNAKMRMEELKVQVGALPIIKWVSEERMNEIMDCCRELGVMVANPHTYKLEEGGAHPDIEDKRKLKAEVDPRGILNPGKMKTYGFNPFEDRQAAS